MARKFDGFIENTFESLLFNMRFIVLTPVLGAMVASVIMYIKGTLLIVDGTRIFLEQLNNLGKVETDHVERIVPLLINSVDNYLFATVLLIFSMGIYELFISKIDPASRTSDSRPNLLNIQTLDDLKGNIGKVVLMILIVTFLERSMSNNYGSALDLLYLCIGIILISGALYITYAKGEKKH
ncbi:MAG: YqhA family protein [Chlorobiaceae bacterium]|nr:YqhA family protein [Chlorobiaceae bacterium]